MPERLWAPWRIKYVEGPAGKARGNIFVELPAQDKDRENLILYRGVTAFVILNAYPYTNGHLLVAPFRQTAEPNDLTDAEVLEIGRLVGRSVEWIRRAYSPNGFNIGVNMGTAGGAGIPNHLHWHVVPRWAGDTNFMTTVGDIRVMPEDLLVSYDRLRKAVDADC